MNIIDVIILSIIEGITEFLPISSTGHLILASELLQVSNTDFLKSFEIIIQLGAVLAVVFLYGKTYLLNTEMVKKIMIGFVPTAFLGLLCYSLVKTYLLGNSGVVLGALLIGGILLIVFEFIYKNKENTQADLNSLTYKQAFFVGVCQSVALVPGVSRSAATVIGGRVFGLSMRNAVEFSFLLALPTMLAATGLDLVKNVHSFTANNAALLVFGFALSFIVAVLSIKFLLSFVKNHSFVSFGIYRIILSIVLFFVLF